MFYNEEVKNEFIKDYMRSRVVAFTSLSGMFKKAAIFEEKLNKDCSQFTKDEILKMYKGFEARSVNVLQNYNVYLKNYTAFRIYHKQIENENEYAPLTKDMLTECVDPEIFNQTYITREQLNEIEDELFNYTDKAIVEALWHGISGKSMQDLVSLERKMFSDNKDSLIFPDGRVIPISQKLSEYLDKAFSETEYLCYGATIRVEKLSGYDTLYKERANAYAAHSNDKAFRWIYRRFQNYRNQLGMPMLTMKNIQTSGLWHKLKKGMQQNSCALREFLYTEKGKALAIQYGYKPKYYVDVIASKYEDLGWA